MDPEPSTASIGLYLSVGGILVLLALSAFFSGSETALTAASKARLATLEREGDRRAATVNRLRDSKDRLLGALLLGNNIVNILASSLAAGVLIGLFGDAGVVYATAIMTVLVVIFSEVLPKTYALHRADRAALAVARPVGLLVALLAPATAALTGIVGLILRVFRVDLRQGHGDAEAELRGAIELHGAAAPMSEDPEEVREERRMLRSILDLGDTTVEAVMTHRRDLVSVDADLPVPEIVRLVLASPHTRVPLWRGTQDEIVGILHAKTLLREVKAHGDDLGGRDIASIAAPPQFVPPTMALLDQMRVFRRNRAHMAVVIDEYGALLGAVTLEDILETIVGDITDEHDTELPGVSVIDGRGAEVEGHVSVRALNREMDWDLPEDDATTVAGLALDAAGRIPQEGDSVVIPGFRLDVLRRERHRLALLRVVPLPRDDGAEAPEWDR